jgi:glycosyltransferase involved in cell wall biosynthesis
MDDRISIIVSTYKRKEKLRRLLESFSRVRCGCPLEFIIVDSASGDGTDDVVTTWIPTIDFADVKYHILPDRAPLAHTRNVGISLSTGNIIAFTDDDCMVDPAWLDHLYKQLKRCPDYAGVGGRVLPVGDDIYSRYNTIYRVLEPPHDRKAVIGANCMFWKQPVVDAGLFDEYFIMLGGEETALCMKLGLNGYRFGFEEQAVVYHEYRQSLRDFIATFYHYGNGDKVLYEHSLNGYLQYRMYPEKMHNYVAFRNHALFLLLFLKQMVTDVAYQPRALRRVSSSRKERLMLNCLYAIHQVSLYLGRGTFSGELSKTVEKYLADHPDCLLTIDPDAGNLSPVLEITGDSIPAVMKPGEKAASSITIKNPSQDRYISAGFFVILKNEEDHTVFFRTPEMQTMVFFPMSSMIYHFSLKTPLKEQKTVLQLYLATQQGALVSSRREKVITLASE